MPATKLLTIIDDQISAWEAALADKGCVAISGQPYVVATPDCGLALFIKNCTAYPVATKPTTTGQILGVTHMSKDYAERIAVIHGVGYVATKAVDVPSIRLRELRKMRELLTAS